MKKFLALILFVIIMLSVCGCGVNKEYSAAESSSYSSSSSPKSKLKSAYDNADCEYPWADFGSDWSYVSIDSNPYDYKESDYRSTLYLSDAINAIKSINNSLGLPASLYQLMLETNSLQGRQTKTYNSIGISVSWTYHPDHGLQVIYEIIVG